MSSLSLIELKEKLKPQLESLMEVKDFKITIAEHENNFWILGIEYQKPYKGPSGVMTYFKNETKGIVVDDDTGQIEAII
jgi:predicted type IV restriction endonuclease